MSVIISWLQRGSGDGSHLIGQELASSACYPQPRLNIPILCLDSLYCICQRTTSSSVYIHPFFPIHIVIIQSSGVSRPVSNEHRLACRNFLCSSNAGSASVNCRFWTFLLHFELSIEFYRWSFHRRCTCIH